jgi:hypothetical protein
MGPMLAHTLPGVAVDFVLQEVGTYPPLVVFHALREENRWHHHGNGHLDHPVKRQLVEKLCPAAPQWRAQALARGTALAHAAAGWSFRGRGR